MNEVLKVTQLENKNQFLMEGSEKAIFQSYNSIIAVYDKENDILTLGKDWDYSKTTTKHLYIFLDQMFRYSWSNLKEDIMSALATSNKRKSIQILIDNNIIKYNPDLR